MSIYAVDFETRYDKEVSISTLGVDAYLRHPTTEIYLVAIVGDNGEEFVGHPLDFDFWCLEGHELWSHNAAFDRRVYHYFKNWSERILEGMDPDQDRFQPDLETPLWSCTANLSVYFRGGRSLKKAAANLLGLELSKDVRKAMCGLTPQQMKQTASTDPRYKTFYDEVCAYALNDARVCRQLALEYGPRWPERERRLSDLTIRGCHHGLPLDVEALEEGKAMLETKLWEIHQRLPWVKDGYQPTSPKGLAEHCRRAGIPHPTSTNEDDPRAVAWEEEFGEQYPWVDDLRSCRKANIQLKRVLTLLAGQHEGRFVYSLKYFGASTGRWSGGYGQ